VLCWVFMDNYLRDESCRLITLRFRAASLHSRFGVPSVCVCTDTNQGCNDTKAKWTATATSVEQLPTPRTLLFIEPYPFSLLPGCFDPVATSRVVNKRSRGCLQGLFSGG
jgi:hypothetical protein